MKPPQGVSFSIIFFQSFLYLFIPRFWAFQFQFTSTFDIKVRFDLAHSRGRPSEKVRRSTLFAFGRFANFKHFDLFYIKRFGGRARRTSDKAMTQLRRSLMCAISFLFCIPLWNLYTHSNAKNLLVELKWKKVYCDFGLIVVFGRFNSSNATRYPGFFADTNSCDGNGELRKFKTGKHQRNSKHAKWYDIKLKLIINIYGFAALEHKSVAFKAAHS